jgi:hypothetical protein
MPHLTSLTLASVLCLAAGMPAAHAGDARMAVVKGKDVSGSVFKKIGLPSQDYCWTECVQQERCTGARWGVVAGDTAGLCMLISGDLTLKPFEDLKTYDGKKIVVTAARKVAGGGAKNGT